jgi:hypothetical protein
MTANRAASNADSASIRRYNAFLLLVAGLGGLLYGIDVGIRTLEEMEAHFAGRG